MLGVEKKYLALVCRDIRFFVVESLPGTEIFPYQRYKNHVKTNSVFVVRRANSSGSVQLSKKSSSPQVSRQRMMLGDGKTIWLRYVKP